MQTQSITITIPIYNPLSVSVAGNSISSPGGSVTLTATAAGGLTPYVYNWDFGDGTVLSGSPVQTHSYQVAGMYPVTMTLTDSSGSTCKSVFFVNVGTAPSAPADLTAAKLTDTSIQLQWTPSTDTTATYIAYRSADAGTTYSQIATTDSVTYFYTDSPIDATVDQYYAVAATNQFGTSSMVFCHYSPQSGQTTYLFDFGTATSPLATGYTRITESTKYSAAQKYGWSTGTISSRDRGTGTDINRDFNFTPDGTFLVDLPNGSYSIELVMGDATTSHDQMGVYFNGVLFATVSNTAGQFLDNTYTVSVTTGQLALRLKDLGGTDTNTVINAMVIAKIGPPVAPSNLQVVAHRETQLDLQCQDNSVNEDGFQWQISAHGAGTWADIGNTGVNINTQSATGLTAGTDYDFRVRAFNASGNSDWSNTATGRTDNAPTSPPNPASNLAASTLGPTVIRLTWQDNSSDESGFKIQRSLTSGSGFSTVFTTNANVVAYDDTGLTSSTTYYYRVIATNSAGDANPSNEAFATTSGTDAYGLAVRSAHPRLWYNTDDRMAQAVSWWPTHQFTPNSNSSLYDLALHYLMTGSATSLQTVKNKLTSWFLGWAYQGTANTSTFVAVGGTSGGLAPGITASDAYRWGDPIPVVIDWIWNALSPDERNAYMNGYTTTWTGTGVHNGELVTVPGYTTLVLVNMTRTFGGKTSPGSNYFWGCFRNEVNWALTIYYEDQTTAFQILDFALGATNSRWSNALTYFNAGGRANGGLLTEGSEYGLTFIGYPVIPLYTLEGFGRDLNTETNWFYDAMTQILYDWSPQAAQNSGSSFYFQKFPFSDAEGDIGYPHSSSLLIVAFVKYMSVKLGTATLGRYARKWFDLTSSKAVNYQNSVDAGGTTPLDWRTAGLATTWRYSGADWFIHRTGWDGNETVLHMIGKEVSSGHSHQDNGSFQIMRKNEWITKECTGYAQGFAGAVFQTTVLGAPVPTTTNFAMANLPTTLTYWGNNRTIKFIDGANAGTSGVISSIDPATGIATLSSGPQVAPSAGDKVVIFWASNGGSGGSGYNRIPCHNGLFIGMMGFAQSTDREVKTGIVTSFFDVQSGYISVGYDLTPAYVGVSSPGSHAGVAPRYAKTVVRESYFLDRLETMIVLDRIEVRDFGNSLCCQWSATAMPTIFYFFTRTAPTFDGAAKFTHSFGGQTCRVFTLLPTSPSYNVTDMGDYTGTHLESGWYLKRVDVQDSGTAQRYFLHVIQAKDDAEADITAVITAEDATTWTIDITHATKGSATVVLNKGMAASQGTVTIH